MAVHILTKFYWLPSLHSETSIKEFSFVTTGLFMALQPRIIACGNSIAAFAMAVRFVTGPAVMAAASIAVGLRGVLLHIAIVQVNKTNTNMSCLKRSVMSWKHRIYARGLDKIYFTCL